MRFPDGLRRLAESEHVCHRANSSDMIDMRWWFETAAGFCTMFCARTHIDSSDTTATATGVGEISSEKSMFSIKVQARQASSYQANQDRKGAWQGKPSDLESSQDSSVKVIGPGRVVIRVCTAQHGRIHAMLLHRAIAALIPRLCSRPQRYPVAQAHRFRPRPRTLWCCRVG
jgi:phosphoglycerate dehydrogenase-like enzyme